MNILTQIALPFLASFIVGGANALYWIWRAEKMEHAAFDRGCNATAGWVEAACFAQRTQIVNRMLTSGVPDVERFAEILVKQHYLCAEGCQVDHTQPEATH